MTDSGLDCRCTKPKLVARSLSQRRAPFLVSKLSWAPSSCVGALHCFAIRRSANDPHGRHSTIGGSLLISLHCTPLHKHTTKRHLAANTRASGASGESALFSNILQITEERRLSVNMHAGDTRERTRQRTIGVAFAGTVSQNERRCHGPPPCMTRDLNIGFSGRSWSASMPMSTLPPCADSTTLPIIAVSSLYACAVSNTASRSRPVRDKCLWQIFLDR